MVASILVDDAKLSALVYSSANWTHETKQPSTFNGTLTTLNTKTQNTTSNPLSFSINFYGTDFNLFGPGRNGNGVNIWNLKGLDTNVFHSLKVIPSGGPFTMDYITYTPNFLTQLSTIVGQSLIVDDADESIHYAGSWNKTTGDFEVGLPYLGTMAGTNKTGSNATFNFVGSSVSVYGLLNQQAGNLSVLFSVDGGTGTVYNPFNGAQTVNQSSWSLSQQFFHQSLLPGNHTLAIQLQNATDNQMFWIDSIVYTAEVDTPVNTNTSGGTRKGLSPGLIAIIVVVAVAFVVIFLGGFKKRKAIVGFISTTRTVTTTRMTTTAVLYR